MRLENLPVRIVVDKSGSAYNQIARKMGISAEHLSRLMSKPLKPDMEEKILQAVRDLQEEDQKCGRMD